ncbi:subtilisin-like protein [Lenzites betulinus]|nr:subtilisin-like protein [Lenzites betulinus]
MVSSHLLFSVFATIATGEASALSTPPVRRVLHERLDALPHRWSLHRRADPDTTLPLSIALKQANIHLLDDYLLDIADPQSPNYGKWWTPSRVANTFRPSAQSQDAVRSWLTADGIDAARVQMSNDHSYMLVNVSVAEAERLLAAEYYVYQHEDGSEEIGCHHGYHLPEHVREHVDLVAPTLVLETAKLEEHGNHKRSLAWDAWPHRPHREPKLPKNWRPTHHASECDKAATIECFRELYNFYPNLRATHRNSIGIMEPLKDKLNTDDLEIFLDAFNPDAACNVPVFFDIDHGMQPPNFTDTNPLHIAQADLHFQLVMGLLGEKQDVTMYQIGGGGSPNFLLDALDGSYCAVEGDDDRAVDGPLLVQKQCGGTPAANVISISFNFGGERAPQSYMERQCMEYGKLSMMGVTFLYESGNNGVESDAGLCLADNGTAISGPGAFAPNFPSTCPYVTAVGATQVAPGKSVYDPEIATMSFGSGGGFSNVFLRPRFQHRHVEEYLKRLGDRVDPKLFNSSGRGIPDVSANGFPTVSVVDGEFTLVTGNGTRASTAIFAAILTAVNDARLWHGKSPVGWINPAIYSNLFAGAFNDITVGSNPGCGTDGFPALRGWDPVTGLGTPNFRRLVERWLILP